MDDNDQMIEKWIQEHDNSVIPLPEIEFEPHLLISKVRKHYMEHVIKLLALNYENHQKLLNKNIYLPSAIWRCAKIIETTAAQSSMVINLYRRNIVTMINQVKADTNKGKLNKKLFECLKKPPENEKKSQTTLTMGKDCPCVCTCYQRKKIRRDKPPFDDNETLILNNTNFDGITQVKATQVDTSCQMLNADKTNENLSLTQKSHDADEVMQQMEKLFEGGTNDDDIFDGIFSNAYDVAFSEDIKKLNNDIQNKTNQNNCIIEHHADQISSLDKRLTSLSQALTKNTETETHNTKIEATKSSKLSNKWICEEYFLKVKLNELLDQLRDCNRAKLLRIKNLLADLFGDDSDDEGVMSPLEETSEFITSCKERIAPWVVKLLTPYYTKGRIRGKALFKSLAKHLIRLIYQCSKYPEEYEVKDFIQDFLKNHKMIRCEADFKQFRIENI
ncbi:unnamed protein product [Pieris macdunnoughi]|uniref:Set2 Rpb1 interacting domain-containing protein n=1 Tax=Pieris macdunnoughi TaxID=345717 RepID=A0A821RHQ8_9NEOP|nr:unnamed protein product [Pieris macdunnoughi]